MPKPIDKKLIDAQTATYTSEVLDVMGHYNLTTIAWGTGTVSATVLIEGSPDGVNWMTLLTHTLSTTTPNKQAAANQYVRFVRARISVYTNGTISCTIGLTGFEGAV